MSVVEASSVGVKTMADGTLRITVDIEPRNARDAFSLFGSPGTPMALAALAFIGHLTKQEAEDIAKTPPAAIAQQPKGGALAKLAGMWCNDPEFFNWANSTTHEGVFWHVNGPSDAKDFVCELCDVESRRELDHDAGAAERFNALIRSPFMKHQLARGVTT